MQVKIVVKNKNVVRNPIGNKNLRFVTKDGRISNNQGYLCVSRCLKTGQFTQRNTFELDI